MMHFARFAGLDDDGSFGRSENAAIGVSVPIEPTGSSPSRAIGSKKNWASSVV